MSESYELDRVIPASPKRLFEAWFDSREHTAMTGTAAAVSAGVGDAISLLDGTITGTNVVVRPNSHIALLWQAEEHGLREVESRVEIELITGWRHGGIGSPFEGTTLRLRHSGLPAGQTVFDPDWWEENYFAPMDAHFTRGNNRWTRPG
jgi:uncharacterized protein YndB with AHSA1/START domain